MDNTGVEDGLEQGWGPPWTGGQSSGLAMIVATFLRVFRIRLGHHSMSPVYESGQQMFQGIKSIPHPGYSHPGHSNDLMLIKMNRKIRGSHSVKPIKIASSCPAPGTRCTVSGWGTTSSSHSEYSAPSWFPLSQLTSPHTAGSPGSLRLPITVSLGLGQWASQARPAMPLSHPLPLTMLLFRRQLPQSPPVPECHRAE